MVVVDHIRVCAKEVDHSTKILIWYIYKDRYQGGSIHFTCARSDVCAVVAPMAIPGHRMCY